MKICIATLLILFVICVLLGYSDLSKMPFQEFDQTQGSGWRKLAMEGKHEEAAKLIDRYLLENADTDKKKGILNFHAGQMYAFADISDLAVDRFKKSYNLDYPEDFEPYAKQWNSYVNATIAFLEKDREALLKHKDEIVQGPDGGMKENNGRVVDRLIEHFGRSYSEAYTGVLNKL